MAKGKTKVEKVMHEFKTGTLHSGSAKGPKVTDRRQAVAIAMSEAGKTKGRRAAKGAAVLLALLLPFPAAAQNAFTPTGPTVNFSVTATTSRVQTQATPSAPNVRVYNSGTVVVFLVCGDVTAVATTAGVPVAPATTNIIGCPNIYIAGIGSTAATVYLTPGYGN